MSGSDGAIATAIYLLQLMGCVGFSVVVEITPCAYPKNRDGFKYIAGHALVGIYNVQTNGYTAYVNGEISIDSYTSHFNS